MFLTGAACDKCGEQALWRGARCKYEVIALLRKEGWSVGKRTLCPFCRTTPKKKEEK